MSALLTTRQVAERLALSPETVLRRVRAGELPAYRIASNALRFNEADIEAFLERVAVTSQATDVSTLSPGGAPRRTGASTSLNVSDTLVPSRRAAPAGDT